MASFRDIKRKARRALHQKMLVPALYIVGDSAPVLVHVRVHTKFDALGDMKGTNFNYAERQDVLPRLLFMRDEVAMPARGAYVSISATEAYTIDHTDPADDISITAFVTPVLASEFAALDLPYPEESDG